MTLHVNFFSSSIQRFQNHYWFTVTHCTVSKAKEVALVILRLLSSCYHVQICRTRKRNFFLQSASERKYCWLTSIGVLTRLKRFSGLSLFRSKFLYASVREKSHIQSLISLCIALQALIAETLFCVYCLALLLLPPFFPRPPLQVEAPSMKTQIATNSRV